MDAVRVEQSPKTRPDNSRAPDSHLSGNFNTHCDECEDQVKVAGEGQPGGIKLDPGRGEKPEDGQSPSQRPGGGEEDGEVKEDGAVTAGQNKLSIAVLFDKLDAN